MAATTIHGQKQIRAATIDKTNVNSTIIRGDGVNAFTADQPHGGFKITGLGAGVAATDAATVAQVDAARQGVMVKDPVRVATTANITLSGTQTVDGVALSVGNRVLVKDQTTGQNNGIYLVAAGAWTRTVDADVSAEVLGGLLVWVNEGTTNGDKQFILTTNDPITLGTTPLVFTMFAGGTSYTAGAGLALTGAVFDVTNTDTSITVGTDTVSVNVNATGGLETATGVKVKLDGATLAIGAAGTKVASAGITATELATSVAGNGLAGGGGTALSVNVAAAGGLQIATDAVEVKLDTASLVLSASGIKVNYAKHVKKENPSGTVNGSNVTFTLLVTPVTGTEEVFLNGLLQEGAGEDYTLTTNSIAFVTAPETGARIRVNYIAP